MKLLNSPNYKILGVVFEIQGSFSPPDGQTGDVRIPQKIPKLIGDLTSYSRFNLKVNGNLGPEGAYIFRKPMLLRYLVGMTVDFKSLVSSFVPALLMEERGLANSCAVPEIPQGKCSAGKALRA